MATKSLAHAYVFSEKQLNIPVVCSMDSFFHDDEEGYKTYSFVSMKLV